MGNITDEERGFFTPIRRSGVSADERLKLRLRLERVLDLSETRVKSISWYQDALMRSPWEYLSTGFFYTEEDRLLFLRYAFEHELSRTGAVPSRANLLEAMLQYEVTRIEAIAAAKFPAPLPSTPYYPPPRPGELDVRGIGEEWHRVDVEQRVEQQTQFASFLAEYERLKDEQQQEQVRQARQAGPVVMGGVAGLQQYHERVNRARAEFIAGSALRMVSIAVDFVPIIGQIKALSEAVIGYDLLTGDKLAAWERGLSTLLAVIPFSRGLFKAGKVGMTTLAADALKSRQPAEKVYRAAEVASRMSEADVQAAKIAAGTRKAERGAQLTQALERVAGHLDEMTGSPSRGFRAVQGTLVDGRSIARSAAASPIDTAKVFKPGKVIQATKPTKALADGLAKANVSAEAIEALSRAGANFSKLGKHLTKPEVVNFLNTFHRSPGFEHIVADLAVKGGKADGALFVMSYALKKVDPNVAKFELATGITKRARSTEVAARRVDIVVRDQTALRQGESINIELKSWTRETLEKAMQKPSQLVKDTALFGRKGSRWVFNSTKIKTKDEVIDIFVDAITKDRYLSKKWPTGKALRQALGQLIEMFPM